MNGNFFSLSIIASILVASCAEVHYGDDGGRKNLGDKAGGARENIIPGQDHGSGGYSYSDGSDHGGSRSESGDEDAGDIPKSCEDRCNKSFMDARKACDKAYPNHQKEWMKCAEEAMYAGDSCRADC